MTSDYKMLRAGVNSLSDFQRAQEEFELKKAQLKAQATGQDPASVKLANEIQKARASGDTQRLNDLQMSAKLLDRGVVYDQMGNPISMGGYGQAVGEIAGAKKGYEANAQNVSDLYYDPQIAGGEARARLEQQLRYEPMITGAQREATNEADTLAELNKKARQDVTMTGSIQRAREILPQATSGRVENIASSVARIFGKSTDKTQADAQLEIIAAELVQNVPRFEGPQSNIDVQFYKDAAADVGNPNKSTGDRLAALQAIQDRIELRQSQGLLGGQNVQTNMGNPYATVNPATNTPYENIQPNISVEESQPARGDIVDGYMYLGGDPSNEKSWKKAQ